MEYIETVGVAKLSEKEMRAVRVYLTKRTGRDFSRFNQWDLLLRKPIVITQNGASFETQVDVISLTLLLVATVYKPCLVAEEGSVLPEPLGAVASQVTLQ